ncbi:hypothetical protein FRB90_003072 [Tulasnella sp. 427]|nr:hypothetical protein FRB90_003072 [Tulasnella sp. 427]
MTDSADEYDAYFDQLDEKDLQAIDQICDRFAALESPSKASTSRAKAPEPEQAETSETDDEIDFPPSAQPSMSPDRTTKGISRQPRSRTSTPSKRSPRRSNSPLTLRVSRCPTPRYSATKVKPLPLRAESPDRVESSTAPKLEPKVEPPPAEPPARLPTPPPSLLKLFRPRGRLTVTDLVTPSWCESKFDYSLRGQRWRGANMQDVVVSKHGKAIPVQKTVVIQADKNVHKKLEEALPVVEVIVKIKTAEERFALQLLNMIANFQMLIDIGTCREFHVMGFINGYYITGIIDEINRLPTATPAPTYSPNPSPSLKRQPFRTPSSSPRKRKGQAGVLSPTQRTIDSFFQPSPSRESTPAFPALNLTTSPGGVIYIDSDYESDVEMKRASQESKDEATVAGPPSSTPPEVEMRSAKGSQESEPPVASQNVDQGRGDKSTFRLHLNDTKTRSVNSMPKDDLSGRLQLMLYHQLLGRLLGAARHVPGASSSSSSAALSFTFSFEAVLQYLRLDAFKGFSEEFIIEASELLDSFDAFSSSQGSSQGTKASSQKSTGRAVRNLNDLMRCWHSTVRRLRLQLGAPIDDELELVYRMREEADTKGKFKGKGRAKTGDKQASFGATDGPIRLANLAKIVSPKRETASPEPLEVAEEQMVQHAIVESLKSQPRDSQSSNGTDDIFYTPLESMSQDPDYKPSSSVSVKPEPLPTPPPSSSPLPSSYGTAPSQSRPPSPREEKEEIALQNEAVEEHIAGVVTASQGSDMDWEAMFGDSYIRDEELAAIELPATCLSPVKKKPSQEESSKGKGKEKAPLVDLESPKSKSSAEDSNIIGSKKFAFDQGLLNKHIVAAIEFWESKREPRGVELEDTWKCGTCEFRNGCEWREAKAAELLFLE